jgi:predicted Zn-dependent protease
MKVLILAVTLTVLLVMPAKILHAEEEKASDWRARASIIDRDTYTETDTDEEVNFGREIAARVLGQYKLSGNSKLQKYVSLVGTTLTQNCNRPEIEFHFAVIESSEINAYSTPGGYVFVTTAVLEKMENEAELAGVLAHEISHVTERHIVKELSLKGTEKSSVASIAAFIGGASESVGIAFSQAVDKAVDIILRDGYKKEDEIQADVSAVMLCAVSGYDPSSLITFLTKVGKLKEDVGKTYPVYDVRRAILQKSMEVGGIAGMKLALNTARFDAATKKPENKTNPLNILRNVIPGGKP